MYAEAAINHNGFSLVKMRVKLLGTALAVSSFIAVGWFAFRALRLDVSLHEVRWVLFGAAIALQLVVVLALPYLWVRLLGFLGGRTLNEIGEAGKLAHYKAYSRSWLARYIPGRIWTFGGRMLLAKKLGIPSVLVLRSMAFEIIFSYGTLAIIGVSLLLVAQTHLLFGGLTLALGAVFLSVGIPVAQRMLSSDKTAALLRYPFLRRAHQLTSTLVVGEAVLSRRNSGWGVAAYGLHSCLQVAFVILLSASFTDLTVEQAAIVGAAWALSVSVGYFTFLTPAGLGVRDGIALALFSQALDAPTAGLIVASSRVVSIVGDVAFVGAVEAWNMFAMARAGGFRKNPRRAGLAPKSLWRQ